MTRVKKGASTPQQLAYARRIFSGQGESKKQIALDVGYSMNTANSLTRVENTQGFHNAMYRLAAESNNLAMAIMHEFASRGVEDFSNKDLVGALNAIGGAWSKFNSGNLKEVEDNASSKNKLRTIILQRVENQTIESPQVKTPIPEEDPNDF